MSSVSRLSLKEFRQQFFLVLFLCCFPSLIAQIFSPTPRPKNGFLEFDNAHIHIFRIYDIHRNIYQATRTRSQTRNLKTPNYSFLCVFCNDVVSVHNNSVFCTDCNMMDPSVTPSQAFPTGNSFSLHLHHFLRLWENLE